jgi:hypothetical protein
MTDLLLAYNKYVALGAGAGAALLILGVVALLRGPRPASGAAPARPLARLAVLVGGLAVAFGAVAYPVLLAGYSYAASAHMKRALDEHLYRLRSVANGQAVRAILDRPKYDDPKRLNRFEHRAFSQNGEDGILAEIFRRIGTTGKTFVECGAADGFENNTVLLLRYAGWNGLWIDGDPALCARARGHFREEIAAGRLKVREAFITAENIESLLREAGTPTEPDLLSIDIDRNDYYVWRAVTHYRPRVVACEYNGLLPPAIDWVVPYDGAAWWDRTTRYGASLKALERLAGEKGYRLVGCGINGVNAFFVREDLVGDHFAAPYTAENHYEPARHELYRDDSNHVRKP